MPGKVHRIANDVRYKCNRLGFHIQGGADGVGLVDWISYWLQDTSTTSQPSSIFICVPPMISVMLHHLTIRLKTRRQISFRICTCPIVIWERPQALIYAVPFRFADRPQKLAGG